MEKDIKALLENINIDDYDDLINPVYDSTDKVIEKLCDEFKAANKNDREKLRRIYDSEEYFIIYNFIERACVFYLRNGDLNTFKNRLIALSLKSFKSWDMRDIINLIHKVVSVARYSKLNLKEVFKEIVDIAESEVAKSIKSHYGRRIIIYRIPYELVKTKYGIGFVSTRWGGIKLPKQEIVDLLIEVRDYLSEQKLQKVRVDINSDFPGIWVGFENFGWQEKLWQFRITNSVRATADDINQSLWVWILEFKNEKHVEKLIKIALKNIKHKDTPRIYFGYKNIFCMVLQDSFMQGEKPVETVESLERFRKPILKLIKNSL